MNKDMTLLNLHKPYKISNIEMIFCVIPLMITMLAISLVVVPIILLSPAINYLLEAISDINIYSQRGQINDRQRH
jgi:hypothetical protein